jgi:hypothetical protein
LGGFIHESSCDYKRQLAGDEQEKSHSIKGRTDFPMRVSLVTWLSAVCVPVAALTATANASAATHYYSLLQSWNGVSEDAANGEFINIQTNILHQTCSFPTYDELNHEMWYGTSPDDARGNYWIEVGFKDGVTNGGSCMTDTLFWADSRPDGGGYNEHYFNIGVDWNNWEVLQITRTDSCTWDIQAAGFDIGTSTNYCPWDDARLLQAGFESTSQRYGSGKGFLIEWWELDNNNNWISGWDGQNINFQNNPPNIQWADLTQAETEEVHNENP